MDPNHDYDYEFYLKNRSRGERYPPWAMARRDASGVARVLGNPRLFISHQRADDGLARQAWAWAKAAGFYVWLDVLDPALGSGNPSSDPKIIAGIIEVALLNCSHLVAVMTDATAKSRWVPYEYGRVKGPVVVSEKVAAWEAATLRDPIPEYCHLAQIHNTESAFKGWLKHEAAICRKTDREAEDHRRTLL